MFNPSGFFKKRTTRALSEIQRAQMSANLVALEKHHIVLQCVMHHSLSVYTLLANVKQEGDNKIPCQVEHLLLWLTRMRSWQRVRVVQGIRCWWWWWWREASEEGLLLPLALVTSATCRKVKRSAFESVCSTAADDVDRA